jgi:gamma-glutamylcyclotransferase (GGCT)/AIG2-like uncharacterized protein YtfP
MDRSQMNERCPQSQFFRTIKFDGYEFLINAQGVATLIENKNSHVFGVLWKLTKNCEESLDFFEGVATNDYVKKIIFHDELHPEEILVYIATDSEKSKPLPGYLEKICSAAEREGLSEEYVSYLKTHF